MAGTLTISTLSDGTNSTSSTNCIQGSAKAWVCFNAATATVVANYNVSSITNNGTGNFTVNFTSGLSDANYASVGSASYTDATTNRLVTFNTTLRSTTQCQLSILNGSATGASDSTRVSVSFFR